jgi:hypothetical protein
MTNTKSANKTPARAGKARAARTEPAAASKPSRLDQIEQLLTREGGASIAEMVEVTGWQQHSARGAMAGALKKRGLTITSEKVDGVRRYRATVAV